MSKLAKDKNPEIKTFRIALIEDKLEHSQSLHIKIIIKFNSKQNFSKLYSLLSYR